MKPTKHSIAYAIYNKDRSKVLAVLRPEDDDNLPNVWGLPAGTLKEGEDYEQAVICSGHDKLGIELKVIKLINEGGVERDKLVLHMKEYEAEIASGQPSVPQPVDGVTQYQQWKWAEPDLLKEAAQKGSLCSRLLLSHIGRKW